MFFSYFGVLQFNLEENKKWNREDMVIGQLVCNQNVGGKHAKSLENRKQNGTHFLSASELSF